MLTNSMITGMYVVEYYQQNEVLTSSLIAVCLVDVLLTEMRGQIVPQRLFKHPTTEPHGCPESETQ